MQALIDQLKQPESRPLVLTGAGISLASGIPTFRGSDPDAVWSKDVLEMGTYAEHFQEPSEVFLPRLLQAMQ